MRCCGHGHAVSRLGRLLRGRGAAPLPVQHQAQQRRALAAAAASTAASPTTARPSPLESPFLLTLERAVGDRAGVDAALAATGLFGAEVFPDLPLATTWEGLYKAMLRHVQSLGRGTPAPHSPPARRAAAGPGAWRVETIGAQLRDKADLESRIRVACGRGPDGGPLRHASVAAASSTAAGGGSSSSVGSGADGGAVPPAEALLFVSGSHPARQVPGVDRFLPSSVTLLRTAAALRSSGAIPSSTSLWAVANPVTEADASRTEAKIEAGAEVILTQPPLDWGAFERWWADAEARGLPKAAKLLIGFPALSGSGNASFWVALAGGGGSAAARGVVTAFAAAEAKGKDAAAAFAHEYSEKQLRQLTSIPGLGGLHVMPLTPAARLIVLDLADQGLFAPQPAR